MANTYFRIKKASVVGEPAEPPFDAWPLVEAPPIVTYREPQASTGEGYPAAVAGLPYTVIGRNEMNQTGAAYYNALFANATDSYASVKAQLYDERTQTWKVYSGILWRATHEPNAKAGVKLLNYRHRLTELAETTW